ncbi:MAG TPA: A24 family peptidase [Crenalkalicoccus sp.]|nr:A24 family peptidase [Crenalkalicoccus sp.]
MPSPSLAFLLLAAPCVGSFLGTLILRLPRGRPVLLARSACPCCGSRLGPRDLVPLLSWLATRGQCRHCGARIPAFYPGIELAALGIALWAAAVMPEAALPAGCLLGWGLLALAVIDRREFLLPDALTLPLVAAGLAVAVWLDPAAWPAHAAGAALGWATFAGLAALYRSLRGVDGLGGGDARLLAAGGAWLGWAALPGVVLVASLFGLAEALLRRAAGERLGGSDRIAFGAWLALAIWLAWLYGPLLPA